MSECEHKGSHDKWVIAGVHHDQCNQCGEIDTFTRALNETTCVKCGTEGPHTMTFRFNHSLKPYGECLKVTCRMCGHGFGTMPCKDAKEDV